MEDYALLATYTLANICDDNQIRQTKTFYSGVADNNLKSYK